MLPEPKQCVIIYSSVDRKDCAERALVLQALDIPGALTRDEGGWRLSVDEQDAPRALAELSAFAEENRDWPHTARPLARLAPGVHGVVAYVLILLGIAWCQSYSVFDGDWLRLGGAQARAITNGELWRTVTALTLHLDLGHLVGNLFFGALFGLFIGQYVGSGVAWLGILLAGAAGNLVNSWLQQPWHTSAGASTAVFAALGMLSAYVWRRRADFDERWPYRWAPIMAGIALLAYTGAGGERTDVGAHLTGFLCGLSAGALFGSVDQSYFRNRALQGSSAFLAAALVMLAWTFALGGRS